LIFITTLSFAFFPFFSFSYLIANASPLQG